MRNIPSQIPYTFVLGWFIYREAWDIYRWYAEGRNQQKQNKRPTLENIRKGQAAKASKKCGKTTLVTYAEAFETHGWGPQCRSQTVNFANQLLGHLMQTRQSANAFWICEIGENN